MFEEELNELFQIIYADKLYQPLRCFTEADVQVPLNHILHTEVDISESSGCMIGVVSYCFPIAYLYIY